jgi:hypothetical protein
VRANRQNQIALPRARTGGSYAKTALIPHIPHTHREEHTPHCRWWDPWRTYVPHFSGFFRWRGHPNRRHASPDQRRRSIAEGLAAEDAFADLLDRLGVPYRQRRELVATLRQRGWSLRRIAGRLNEDKSSIGRDATRVPDGTPPVVTGSDGARPWQHASGRGCGPTMTAAAPVGAPQAGARRPADTTDPAPVGRRQDAPAGGAPPAAMPQALVRARPTSAALAPHRLARSAGRRSGAAPHRPVVNARGSGRTSYREQVRHGRTSRRMFRAPRGGPARVSDPSTHRSGSSWEDCCTARQNMLRCSGMEVSPWRGSGQSRN